MSAHSLFEEAERLVKAATKSAGNPIDAIYMTGNLGEILRAKGDLESALSVLRAVVEDEQVLVDTEVSVGIFRSCRRKVRSFDDRMYIAHVNPTNYMLRF